MATRKIKDAKDLATDELIYFKGHAKATFMSDGRTVEDAIHQIGTGPYPIVESSDTVVTLSANKMTRITVLIVDSLELILPDELEGLTSECVVTFKVDLSSAGAELIVPADVRWADGIIPAMTAGKTYEVSFLNRCATFLEF